MGHQFDTGLDAPQRTLIRRAIIQKLAPLLRSANPPRYLLGIKMLPRVLRGESDAEGKEMLIAAFNNVAPAVGVALGRKRHKSSGTDGVESRGELEIAVYAVSAHSRDIVIGRLESDTVAEGNLESDPGIEVMLEHIEERLLGQSLGLDTVSELRPTEEDEVLTLKEFSVWELKFTCEVERIINPQRDVTQLLLSIENQVKPDGITPAETGFYPLITAVSNIPPEDP